MSYDSVILADTPEGYWKFDADEDGTDETGNGNTASPNQLFLIQAGSGSESSPDGRAIISSSATSWINLPVTCDSSDWTVEFWIKTTTTGVGQLFSGITGTPQATIRVWIGNYSGLAGAAGRIVAGWEKDGSPSGYVLVGSTAAVNDGAWHHVAVVWDGTSGSPIDVSEFKIYVDGTNVTSGSASGGTIPNAPVAGPSGVYHVGGATGYITPQAFQVDSVALYKAALSSGQVAAHFAALPVVAVLSGGGQLVAVPAPRGVLSGGGQLTAIVAAVAELSGGGQLQAIIAPAIVLSGGGDLAAGIIPEQYPASDPPAIPAELAVVGAPVRRRSETYDAPTLDADGIPINWGPS